MPQGKTSSAEPDQTAEKNNREREEQGNEGDRWKRRQWGDERRQGQDEQQDRTAVVQGKSGGKLDKDRERGEKPEEEPGCGNTPRQDAMMRTPIHLRISLHHPGSNWSFESPAEHPGCTKTNKDPGEGSRGYEEAGSRIDRLSEENRHLRGKLQRAEDQIRKQRRQMENSQQATALKREVEQWLQQEATETEIAHASKVANSFQAAQQGRKRMGNPLDSDKETATGRKRTKQSGEGERQNTGIPTEDRQESGESDKDNGGMDREGNSTATALTSRRHLHFAETAARGMGTQELLTELEKGRNELVEQEQELKEVDALLNNMPHPDRDRQQIGEIQRQTEDIRHGIQLKMNRIKEMHRELSAAGRASTNNQEQHERPRPRGSTDGQARLEEDCHRGESREGAEEPKEGKKTRRPRKRKGKPGKRTRERERREEGMQRIGEPAEEQDVREQNNTDRREGQEGKEIEAEREVRQAAGLAGKVGGQDKAKLEGAEWTDEEGEADEEEMALMRAEYQKDPEAMEATWGAY